MRPAAVVEGQVAADRAASFADRVVGSEVDLLLFDRAPEPFDEDAIPPSALSVHADGDASLEQHGGELLAGELRALDALLCVKQRRRSG